MDLGAGVSVEMADSGPHLVERGAGELHMIGQYLGEELGVRIAG